jgi:hypothetical protein
MSSSELAARRPSVTRHRAERLPLEAAADSSESEAAEVGRPTAPRGMECRRLPAFGREGAPGRPLGVASDDTCAAVASRRLRPAASSRASTALGTDTSASEPLGVTKRVWTPRSHRPRRPSSGLLGGTEDGARPRAPMSGSLLSPGGTAWWSAVASRAKAGRLGLPFGVDLARSAGVRHAARPSGRVGWTGCPASDAVDVLRARRRRNWLPSGCDDQRSSGTPEIPCLRRKRLPKGDVAARRAAWRCGVGVEPGSDFVVGPKLERGGLGGFPRSVGAG